MIIDAIADMQRYFGALPQLRTVSHILSTLDRHIENGAYLTDDPAVRYNVMSYETKNDDASEYEVHRREIDVQVLLAGKETMKVASSSGLEITRPYDGQKDAGFVSGRLLAVHHAADDTFAVFFPGEPHAPCLIWDGPSDVKKVVFKLLA